MPSEQTIQDLCEAVRHGTKDYLRHVKSKRRLLARVARTDPAALTGPLLADCLFYWWDALINPADPGLQKVFTSEELVALTRFDAVVREFHQTSGDRKVLIEEIVSTNAYTQIAEAARVCSESLA
jgi:hypothetical protein